MSAVLPIVGGATFLVGLVCAWRNRHEPAPRTLDDVADRYR